VSNDPGEVVALGSEERDRLVAEKATCPFIGSVIAQGTLPVRNAATDPLASIEDVRRLGNSGGGDLGDLLVLFASGNHGFMRGDGWKLDRRVPDGSFSLEFPGSQGSHPGHSGILQGNPLALGSGRLSRPDFDRLVARAKDGLLKRSDVGLFIAENLHRDKAAKVFGKNVALLLASDLHAFVESIGPAFMSRLLGHADDAASTHRVLEEKLTKLLGEDNLVGAAGEYGLLFALLANQPGAQEIDGEPALAVHDLEVMFLDKRLPVGWQTWKKSRLDWVKHTTALLISAGKAYQALARGR
jgi:hypothetical protein